MSAVRFAYNLPFQDQTARNSPLLQMTRKAIPSQARQMSRTAGSINLQEVLFQVHGRRNAQGLYRQGLHTVAALINRIEPAPLHCHQRNLNPDLHQSMSRRLRKV